MSHPHDVLLVFPRADERLLQRALLRTWRWLSPNAGARYNAATALQALTDAGSVRPPGAGRAAGRDAEIAVARRQQDDSAASAADRVVAAQG